MSAAPGGTLFALSSGAPPAAIAIVRISGPDAGTALTTLAGRLPPPRRAALARLRDERGSTLDHALVLWFPGPASATGEDLAELHLHGGRAVIAAVLDALGRLPGLAPAPPGAFTRRAFANGRIDLAAAEGLADLLAAETEGQRRQAMRLVEGELGRLIDVWRGELLRLAAEVEALIDHEEELDAPPSAERVREGARALCHAIDATLVNPPAERLRDGVRVLLAGPVNAGKSSLLNVIAGRDIAITSPVEGTTRDLIEAPLTIDGVPIVLIDSAGLRDSDDIVERIGVARARDALDAADLVLWLGGPAEAPDHSQLLCVATKTDLLDDVPGDLFGVSALTGQGIGALRASIAARARALLPAEDRVALQQRHVLLLRSAVAELSKAAIVDDLLLIAEHLRLTRMVFDQVTGRAGVEEMFDQLFGRFCIGK